MQKGHSSELKLLKRPEMDLQGLPSFNTYIKLFIKKKREHVALCWNTAYILYASKVLWNTL